MVVVRAVAEMGEGSWRPSAKLLVAGVGDVKLCIARCVGHKTTVVGF
ncbi:hypothetical protein M6B38_120215 [Iris pallida]|uniref:Uncharacterized protein n=1 Tax=Iris pallida TaxID=29817 RepID=A0AAX6HAD4_IRIPA|nr:hypothetical protein M6B38_120215 [Iris pallida]